MENTMLGDPTIVRMIQSVYFQTIMNQVKKDKKYLESCSVDEFVKVSELIRNDEDFEIDILKEIIYYLIYREDLLIFSDLILCNIGYYLEKFTETPYKQADFILTLLLNQYKKEICIFNKYLIKYILELIKKNLQKFKPEVKSEVLEMVL
jgi:hypothetical protein